MAYMNIKKAVFAKSITTSISKLVVLLLLPALMVACSSGGGSSSSGGDGVGPIRADIFSHSSYNFYVADMASGSITRSISAGGLLGRVRIDQSKLALAVANALSTATNTVDAATVLAPTAPVSTRRYSLEYSVAGNPSSVARTFFDVKEDATDPLLVEVHVKNPLDDGSSLHEILQRAGSLVVEIKISLTGTEDEVFYRVPVNLSPIPATGPNPADLANAFNFDEDSVTVGGSSTTTTPPQVTISVSSNLSGGIAANTELNRTATPVFSFTDRLLGRSNNNNNFVFVGYTPAPAAGGNFPGGNNGLAFSESDLIDSNNQFTSALTISISNQSSAGVVPFTHTFSIAAGETLAAVNTRFTQLAASATFTTPSITSVLADNITYDFSQELDWHLSYSYDRQYQPQDVTSRTPGMSTAHRTSTIAENNDINAIFTTATVRASNNRNLLSAFGLTYQNPRGHSFSLQLSDATDPNMVCNSAHVYVDSQTNTVRTVNISYDFENQPTLDTCRLAVSGDGADYKYVGLPFVTSTPASSTAVGSGQTERDNLVGCDFSSSSTSTCYYATLDFDVTNVDEKPTIQFSTSGTTSFTGSAEGKGAIANYNSNPGFGTLATDQELRDTAVLNIQDAETLTPGGNHLAATPRITGVSPNHFRDFNSVFSLATAAAPAAPNTYELLINTTLLDYEVFTEDQLTADDKAIYKISITATDDASADGGRAQQTTETFDFEVTNVYLKPVPVPPVRGSTVGFVKERGIVSHPTSGNLIILPGLEPFLNGLHRLGSYRFVNPETGNDEDIYYNHTSTTTELEDALGLLDSGAQGRTLIVKQPTLRPGASGTVILRASYEDLRVRGSHVNLRSAGAELSAIDVQVQDPATMVYYNSTSSSDYIARSQIGIIFSQASQQGSIAEGTGSPLVEYDDSGTTRRDLTFNIKPPLTSSDVNFGFVPQDILASYPGLNQVMRGLGDSAFPLNTGIENFRIDSGSGFILPATGENLVFNDPTGNKPSYYLFAVYGLASTDASSDPTELRQNIRDKADIMLTYVTVTDDNAAPDLSGFTPAEASPGVINVTVDENRGGVRLASFNIKDDNERTVSDLDASATGDLITSDDVEVTARATGNGNFAVSVRIKNAEGLDYETLASNPSPITMMVSDKGQYRYNTGRGTISPVSSPGTNVESVMLTLNIMVNDVYEPIPPTLRVCDSATFSQCAATPAALGNISEDATSGEFIDAAGGTEPLAFQFANAADALRSFGVSSLTSAQQIIDRYDLVLEGPLADMFNIVPAAEAGISNQPAAFVLELKDAAAAQRLENLGDGRRFQTTVRITHKTQRALTASVSVPVQIHNIDYGLTVNAGSLALFVINEQDAANNPNMLITEFNIDEFAMNADSDDPPFAGQNLVDLSVEIGRQDLLYNSAFIVPLASNRTLSLTNSGKNYRLNLAGQDLIENALFGDILAEFVARDNKGRSASVPFKIIVNPAPGKAIAYLNAATVPEYAVIYGQSDYDSATGIGTRPLGTANLIDSTAINMASDVRPGQLIRLSTTGTPAATDTVYNTGSIRVGALGTFGVIARDATSRVRNNAITPLRNLDTATGLGTDNKGLQTILIPVSTSNPTIEVLTQDATSGNLVADSARFNRYFDLQVVESGTGSALLNITQKVYSFQSQNATIAATSYNALDTLPLYEGATEEFDMTFYLHATTAGGSASSRAASALAKFTVKLRANGVTRNDIQASAIISGTISADALFEYSATEGRTGAMAGAMVGTLGVANSADFEIALSPAAGTLAGSFLEWSAPAANVWTLQLSRNIEDKDVGVHDFVWTLHDTTTARNGIDTLQGVVRVTVTGTRDSTASDFTMKLQGGTININQETPGGSASPNRFRFNSLSYKDTDLLEFSPINVVKSVQYVGPRVTYTSPDGRMVTCQVETARMGTVSNLLASSSNDVNGIADAVYDRRPNVASVSFSQSRELKYAQGNSEESLGLRHFQDGNFLSGDSTLDFCAELENIQIGTRVTQLGFAALHATIGAEGNGTANSDKQRFATDVVSTDNTGAPSYTIQGYRIVPPTAQLQYGQQSDNMLDIDLNYVSDPDNRAVLVALNLTDGDPDDGVAHNPTAGGDVNVIRPAGDQIAVAWEFDVTISPIADTGANCGEDFISAEIAEQRWRADTSDSSGASSLLNLRVNYGNSIRDDEYCTFRVVTRGEDSISVAAQLNITMKGVGVRSRPSDSIKSATVIAVPQTPVVLDLSGEEIYYTLSEGATPNDIYYFLEGRKWQLDTAGDILSYVGSAYSLDLLPNAGNAAWTNYFHNLPDATAQDVFFGKVRAILDADAGNDSEDSVIDPALIAAGYNIDFFATLEAYDIAGYLRLTDYETALNANPVRNLATAPGATPADNLVTLTATGLGSSADVRLQVNVCKLGTASALDIYNNQDDFVCLDSGVIPAVEAANFVTIANYWDRAACDTYEYCGGSQVSGGQLSTVLGAEDRTEANPIPLHFAAYVPAKEQQLAIFAKPALYMVEVIPVDDADPTWSRGLPLRFLFELNIK